jgi:hypothetical protein
VRPQSASCSGGRTNARATCCESHAYFLPVGRCIARHRGLDLAQVEIRVITAPGLRLDRDRDRTRLWESTKRLRLLVLDPLVRLHGVDENNAGEAAELLAYFCSLQRQLDLSVLLVHHTRTNAAGSCHRPGAAWLR